MEDGGIQGLEYLHGRRRDAGRRGLHCVVEVTPDLTAGIWSAAGVSELGTALVDDRYETVANRVSAGEYSNVFIRLKVGIDTR